jgi:hypothetical protein
VRDVKDETWDLVGVVAAAERGTRELRVRVGQIEVPAPSADPVWLRVPDGVEITATRPDGSVVPASAADVLAGARIAARHTGAELRSLPPQYVATRVRILTR